MQDFRITSTSSGLSKPGLGIVRSTNNNPNTPPEGNKPGAKANNDVRENNPTRPPDEPTPPTKIEVRFNERLERVKKYAPLIKHYPAAINLGETALNVDAETNPAEADMVLHTLAMLYNPDNNEFFTEWKNTNIQEGLEPYDFRIFYEQVCNGDLKPHNSPPNTSFEIPELLEVINIKVEEEIKHKEEKSSTRLHLFHGLTPTVSDEEVSAAIERLKNYTEAPEDATILKYGYLCPSQKSAILNHRPREHDLRYVAALSNKSLKPGKSEVRYVERILKPDIGGVWLDTKLIGLLRNPSFPITKPIATWAENSFNTDWPSLKRVHLAIMIKSKISHESRMAYYGKIHHISSSSGNSGFGNLNMIRTEAYLPTYYKED